MLDQEFPGGYHYQEDQYEKKPSFMGALVKRHCTIEQCTSS
jgi:hypothetical protein